jgi:hypothetical protein
MTQEILRIAEIDAIVEPISEERSRLWRSLIDQLTQDIAFRCSPLVAFPQNDTNPPAFQAIQSLAYAMLNEMVRNAR